MRLKLFSYFSLPPPRLSLHDIVDKLSLGVLEKVSEDVEIEEVRTKVDRGSATRSHVSFIYILAALRPARKFYLDNFSRRSRLEFLLRTAKTLYN